MITMDRNTKWRMNDLVFTKDCATCGIKVEWQHSDPHENNQNNFHSYLYQLGWKRKRAFFLAPLDWYCEKH